jgi:FkbH-like protein
VDSQSSGKSLEAFLEQAAPEFNFDFSKHPADDRALELINKTNQFNLNGRRVSDAAWQNFLKQQDTFLLVTTYRDKYGPLGKIAVIAGRVRGKTIEIENWVMSCRAFSRRIEHRSIEELLRRFDADELILDFEATPKNGPLREFLADLMDSTPSSACTVGRDRILEYLSNRLPKVAEVAHG